MPIKDAKVYICCQCGMRAVRIAPGVPARWEYTNGDIMCRVCVGLLQRRAR